MSRFECPVVPVVLEPHPNADSLSLVKVFDYTCVVRTDDWKDKDLAVYIPVDYVVDTGRPEFGWLKDRARTDGKYRVKAIRLRGVFSMGLLIPLGAIMEVLYDDGNGITNMAEWLGVEKYQPPEQGVPGVRGQKYPSNPPPVEQKYTDIEHIKRYKDVFLPGEVVIATEKVHGANGRWTYQDGKFWCGSHNNWLKDPGELDSKGEPYPDNPWHYVLDKYPYLKEYVKSISPNILYGEVFGRIQDLKYDLPNDLDFIIFDELDTVTMQYKDAQDFFKGAGFTRYTPNIMCHKAPVVYIGPYDKDRLAEIAETDSRVAPGQIMEGLVIKPLTERWDHSVGRVCLKLISQRYLLRKDA